MSTSSTSDKETSGGWIAAARKNKWVRAAIPALLLHCSIGTVYCWSLFSESIASTIGAEKSTIEWAFSLAIFFLGMSAAFLGPFVERDVHKASLIATICFSIGMAGTGLVISLYPSIGTTASVIGIFLFYGVIMGIGLGTGYLSPVKTLMLWFSDQKGLATGLAIAGFGLAKVIASPIMEVLQDTVGLVWMFYILAIAYFVLMFLGHLLLKKPDGWVESHEKTASESVSAILKNKTFIAIWFMFYINITCGLALISQEKSIVKAIGLASAVSVISALTAVFNAGGRLGLSALGDRLKDRNTIYKIIFLSSVAFTGLVVLTQGITKSIPVVVIILLFVVNTGYGGGFSSVPSLLSDHFGMKSISRVHGLCLSAWAVAGLTGNQIASYIVKHTGDFTTDDHGNSINPVGYQNVLYLTIALYAVAFLICFFLVPKSGKAKEEISSKKASK
ncbi:MAG: OFA family MFS transporter [Lachnospiraceae bacterium]|jgi:OFA family oxalate/formate antiporter-like MFS transporter|nr:OFA family MFS transporter [Lachnospiraceae bacterium]